MMSLNLRNYAFVAVAAMLLATVAASMAAYGDVFAYKKNQATSQQTLVETTYYRQT
jgi:hypothetical protein